MWSMPARVTSALQQDAAQMHLHRAVAVNRSHDAPVGPRHVWWLSPSGMLSNRCSSASPRRGHECQRVDTGTESPQVIVVCVFLNQAKFMDFAAGTLVQVEETSLHLDVVIECGSDGIHCLTLEVFDDSGRVICTYYNSI